MWPIPLFCLTLVANLTFVGNVPVDVRTLSGAQVSGTVESIADQQLVIQSANGETMTLPLSDLLSLTPQYTDTEHLPGSPITIELIDGSKLLATKFEVIDGECQFELVGGADARVSTQAKVSTQSVRYVRLGQSEPAIDEQWKQILDGTIEGDLVVVRKNDALDFVEGVIGNIGPDKIDFNTGDEQLSVKRTRVHGLVFYHARTPSLADTAAVLQDLTGNRVAVADLHCTSGRVRVVTPAGFGLERKLEQIRVIDFAAGNITWLSDLEPAEVVWTPYFGGAGKIPSLDTYFRPRKDQALSGGSLTLAGQSHSKGLSIHSRTRMVYLLPDKFKRFTCLAGIDDAAGTQGNVELLIQGDARNLFQGSITAMAGPQPIDLDLSGVRRLTIRVDFGDGLDVGDHLDLCDPRLIK